MMGLGGIQTTLIFKFFVSFTVKITASHLKKIRYSNYQQELWELIKEKHNFGMVYHKISNLLNENGYKTTRGHKFKNTHVYSILLKKRFLMKEYIICLNL